jgi:hypothetical protein
MKIPSWSKLLQSWGSLIVSKYCKVSQVIKQMWRLELFLSWVWIKKEISLAPFDFYIVLSLPWPDFFCMCFLVRQGKHCSITTSPKNKCEMITLTVLIIFLELYNISNCLKDHYTFTTNVVILYLAPNVLFWSFHSNRFYFYFYLVFLLLIRFFFFFSGYRFISPHLLSVIQLG